jgi:hypothetical protein
MTIAAADDQTISNALGVLASTARSMLSPPKLCRIAVE